MVADAIEIGQRLIDAKRLCGHGNWLPWLDREFGWSDDTAINYMRVAELAKSRNIRDLNVPVSGLYLLARPSTPQSVRDDVLQRAADGEAISFEDIKREVSGERPAVVQLSGLAKIAEQLAEDRPDDPLVHELQALVSKMSSRED
jgi:hypothetical protein